MNYCYFYNAYSLDEILEIITILNDELSDKEIFSEFDLLFTIELNGWFLEIKFNGESVIDSENATGWEYDPENDCWSEPLIDFLKGWLLRKKLIFNKIDF